MSILGNCRLCNEYGPLTLEHVPPKKAFNDSLVFLRTAFEKNGHLDFGPRTRRRGGFAQPTLCTRCNNWGGKKFAQNYIVLAKRVAVQLDLVGYGDWLNIMAVEKPARIVQQVLLQFVSLIGEGFVSANPWVRDSIFLRQPVLPENVHLYLFATSTQSMRSTGLLASYISSERRHNVFSEFVSWPLGTVLAFSELSSPYLTPIRHWSEVPVKSASTRDLTLRVNDTQSPAALDFRSASEVERDRLARLEPEDRTLYSDDVLTMQKDWFRKSGSSQVPGLAYLTPRPIRKEDLR